jgi:tellurite resistance protein
VDTNPVLSLQPASSEIREGLLMCMLFSVCLDIQKYPDLLREIALIAGGEPEFSGKIAEFEKILQRAKADLHKDADQLLPTIRKLLTTSDQRRRGLEMAVRVVTSDGIVTHSQRTLLRSLAEGLELAVDDLEDAVVSAQQQLVRFMMVYLVYMTAHADHQLRPEEFEVMIPMILSTPAFQGITTEEFRFISRSVQANLDRMNTDKGLGYLTSTLLNAADLLEDPEIPEQALRVVARGVFADGVVRPAEEKFFLKVAKKLELRDDLPSKVIEQLKD